MAQVATSDLSEGERDIDDMRADLAEESDFIGLQSFYSSADK
jgi:hypothetical protein